MKISKGPGDFFKVIGAKGRATKWIRHSIPAQFRYYEDGAWYVHQKHIDEVRQLGSPDMTVPAPSGVHEDWLLLHLHPSAPMTIVTIVWRALAKLHHPDHGGDEETFKRITAAYNRIKGRLDE